MTEVWPIISPAVRVLLGDPLQHPVTRTDASRVRADPKTAGRLRRYLTQSIDQPDVRHGRIVAWSVRLSRQRPISMAIGQGIALFAVVFATTHWVYGGSVARIAIFSAVCSVLFACVMGVANRRMRRRQTTTDAASATETG